MTDSSYTPVIEATRGAIVESIHFGAAAVVDVHGKLLASVGDPATVTYLRSTAKPFQALPFIERGGAEKYGLVDREIALMCSSHSGTDEHVKVVESIQKKVGVSESDLLCGTHPPIHEPTYLDLVRKGLEPTPNRHNCSGKHTGMLAHALMRELSKVDYINPKHPVQVTILQALAEMFQMDAQQVVVGIDGCSVPTFAVPLRQAALGYARLCDPADLPSKRAEACQRITRAMSTNPDMVGGPGRFTTRIMEVGRGAWVAKSGAQGYLGIGLKPGTLGAGTPGIGIALKISDGDGENRAVSTLAVEVLRQLGALSTDQVKELADYDTRPIYNWRKLLAGELRPCFKLV